jgi:predicted DNA-binding transcriptional regulator AlpA
MTGPDVYGPAEARALLGVGQARLYKLSHRGDFPACTELEIGRVWDGAEVRAYKLARRGGRYEGRPVLASLIAFRSGMSYAQIGRQANVAPTTVAAWIGRALDR